MVDLHFIYGPQGAGKTTYARELSTRLHGVRFSIDEWMWRLYGPDLPPSPDWPWVVQRIERCEAVIWQTAVAVVLSGRCAVLDLGFMSYDHRETLRQMAADKGFTMRGHYITAPLEVRRQRVLDRNLTQGSTFAFNVTPEMFDAMEVRFESPADAEIEAMVHLA